MDVMDIIKDSFVFPSKNIKLLLIFELLSIVAGAFSVIGTIIYVLGFISPEYFMWGGIAVIISMLIGWVLSGYLISVIKSGIELDDDVPEFEWWNNFNNGFNYFIVSIVYYIIPAFIVVVVGYLTNIFGNVLAVAQEVIAQGMNIFMGTTTVFVSEAMAQAMVNSMPSCMTDHITRSTLPKWRSRRLRASPTRKAVWMPAPCCWSRSCM